MENLIPDWEKIIKNVKSWAREVGRIQLSYLGKENLIIETKSSNIDLVTEVDKLSERFLLKAITEEYPDHEILAEETGFAGKSHSDYLWIIDPLDGTTNYAHGLPIFAVSIALQFKKETVLGVVYLPALDLMFETIRGRKAFVNGRKLTAGSKKNLQECLLATGFPYDIFTNKDNNINYFAHLAPLAGGIRRLGAAAYDLANVAAGILDGYWEFNLKIWDIAAGVLLVEEAGGEVFFLDDKRGCSIIAGNHDIVKSISGEMKKVDLLDRTGTRDITD